MKHSEYYARRFIELRNILDRKEMMRLVKELHNHYYEIQIPKRNGTMRTIMVPDEQLKDLQKRIAELFERALLLMDKRTVKIYTLKTQEGHYVDYKVGSNSYGFEKGKSIIQNAEVHKNGKYFFKADITQFFSSINFFTVYHLVELAIDINYVSLAKMESCSRNHAIACSTMNKMRNTKFTFCNKLANKKYIYLIANLVCQNSVLATGSPASPVISNLFMRDFDRQIVQNLSIVSNKQLFKYTRYADDITISSNKPIDVRIKAIVIKHLSLKKLKLNEEKTHFQSNKAKNVITGINCTREGKLTVGRHKKIAIKKLLYKVITEETSDKEFKTLTGNLSYMFSVEPLYTLSMINKYYQLANTYWTVEVDRLQKILKIRNTFTQMQSKKVEV